MEEKNVSLRLYIEICSACNLHCKYCFEEGYSPRYINEQHLYEFFTKCSSHIEDVVITGGEPMLHPSFYEICQFIAKFASVVVTTNGTRLNIPKIKKLLHDYPNIKLQFSLDAIDEAFVDSVREHGVYSNVIEAIHHLNEYHSQIGISSTLTKQTPQMINDIYSFAKDNCITCYFPSILPYGALCANWDEVMPLFEDYISSEKKIVELIANDNSGIISSNKIDWILNRYKSGIYSESQLSEPEIILKIDSSENILCCPATDNSYSCSKISDIQSIRSFQELIDNYQHCNDCQSIGNVSDCDVCPASKYCRSEFCGNCIHLKSCRPEINEFICRAIRYHFNELLDVIEER